MNRENDPHTHRCGLHLTAYQLRDVSDPPLTVQGCGHEWTHERVYNSAEDYANRHRCPNCGEGPWYARVLLPEQRKPVTQLIVVEFDADEMSPEMAMLERALEDVRTMAQMLRGVLPDDHPVPRRFR